MPQKKAEKKIELKLNGRSIKIGKNVLPFSKGVSNEELRKQLKKVVAKEIFSPSSLEENVAQ